MAATRNHSCSSCECDLVKRGLDTALLLLLKIGRLPPEAHLSLTSAMMDLAGFKESLAGSQRPAHSLPSMAYAFDETTGD